MALFPETSKRWGRMALLLNLAPGVGTMVASGNRDDLRPFAIGLAQFGAFLLAVALGAFLPDVAGIILVAAVAWSLSWGAMILMKAS